MKISVMLSCLLAFSCASELRSRNVFSIGTETEPQRIVEKKNVNLLKRVTRQLIGVNVGPLGVGVGVGPIRVAVPFSGPARGVPFGVPGRSEPFGVPNYPASYPVYPVYPEYRYQNEYQNRYRYNYNY